LETSADHDWPFYCEENIWHRCGGALGRLAAAHVVFISNPQRTVAVWQQRAAASTTEPVIWDYHVIALAWADDHRWVHDPGSTLGVPTLAKAYLDSAFLPLTPAHSAYAPLFRWLPADLYRREFRSDRRHMRNAHGEWLAPPPPGPCIGQGSNLMRFVDLEAEFLGEVLDLDALRLRTGSPPRP
jgi:hypothetical protein